MLDPTHILAAADNNFLGWANIVVTAVIGVAVAWLGVVTTKLNRSEDQRREDVKGLRSELHDANTKLIDTRFREMSHSVANHAQQLTTTMDRVTIRVAKSEERLNDIGHARTEAQLELTKAIGGLREFVHEVAVSRQEFHEVKEAIKELTKSVNEVEKQNLSREDMRKLLNEVMRPGGGRP